MLQVWLTGLFLQSEHGIKMTASLEVSSKNKQQAVVHFLVSAGMEGAAAKPVL